MHLISVLKKYFLFHVHHLLFPFNVNINVFYYSFQVNQWLKMMSDASDMLAAALEQMDGIIAGKLRFQGLVS